MTDLDQYIDYSYPILQKVFNYFKDLKNETHDLSQIRIYSCQHLLGPQFEMYKMFIQFGFKPEHIFAFGKAYSSNVQVIHDLENIGINVVQPKFTGISFDIEHANNCSDIISHISDDDQNIILDDGGYLINESKSKHVSFAVEQTSSGFRKLESTSINFPIFNVARSKTKLTQESPIIARIIYERIKAYLQENNIASPKFLIIGLGPIGDSIQQILKEDACEAIGFDIENDKSSIIAYLKDKKPNIIIGATGASVLNGEDLKILEGEHVYHFISVSSSDREFPVVSFRKNEEIHSDVKYKNFVFVNNGFPITFKGNKYESTPIEIEKTIALLMGSVLSGVVRKSYERGFVDVPEDLEVLINQ